MKKITVKYTILVVGVFIYLFIYEYANRSVIKDIKYKYKCISSSSICDSLEILIVGSSHMYNNLIPSLFSMKTFNAATSGQPLIVNKYLIQKNLIAKKKAPVSLKYIIMSLDLADLNHPDDYTVRYTTSLPNDFSSRFPIRDQFYIFHPNYNLAYGYYVIKSIKDEKFDNLGWKEVVSSSLSLDEMKKQGEKRARKYSDFFRFKSKKKKSVRKCLESILEICKKNRIKMFLVNSPKCEYYNNKIDLRTFNLYHDYMKYIVRKYKCVKFLDFQYNSSFVLKDFSDSDHLNAVGAKTFTLKLNQIVTKNK